MATAKETVESGIIPIVLEFSDVKLFDSDEKIKRSFLSVKASALKKMTLFFLKTQGLTR